jgi:S1-C subfamily serine protease
VNGRSLREYGGSHEFTFAIREAAKLSRAVLEVWKYDPVSESYRPSRVEAQIPARVGELLGLYLTFEVVIVKVPRGGAAERAGIKPWDFIQEIDGHVIWDLGSPVAVDLQVNEAASRGDEVSLTVYRWKPAPLNSGAHTIHFPRKVTVPLGVDANSVEPVSDAP